MSSPFIQRQVPTYSQWFGGYISDGIGAGRVFSMVGDSAQLISKVFESAASDFTKAVAKIAKAAVAGCTLQNALGAGFDHPSRNIADQMSGVATVFRGISLVREIGWGFESSDVWSNNLSNIACFTDLIADALGAYLSIKELLAYSSHFQILELTNKKVEEEVSESTIGGASLDASPQIKASIKKAHWINLAARVIGMVLILIPAFGTFERFKDLNSDKMKNGLLFGSILKNVFLIFHDYYINSQPFVQLPYAISKPTLKAASV